VVAAAAIVCHLLDAANPQSVLIRMLAGCGG
jgi:hypothetical protein